MWIHFFFVIFTSVLHFLDSIYKWYHIVFVFLWLISFGIMASKSIYVAANGKIVCLFVAKEYSILCECVCMCINIYMYVYVIYTYTHIYIYIHLLYPFIYWWRFTLFLSLGSYICLKFYLIEIKCLYSIFGL